MKQAARRALHADFFLSPLFDPEDGGDMLLRNIS
jgi:hypothetical protein